MVFFKRNGTNKMVNVDEIFVATTEIIASYRTGDGCSPMCVTWYFLAKFENNEYYELFSGKKLEKEEDTHEKDSVFAEFDTPYIKKTEPLKEYLRDENKKKMDIQLLFDFITTMNVMNSLGAFEDNE